MRRSWPFVRLVIGLLALAAAGCGRKPDPAAPESPKTGPLSLVVPAHGAYTGAYIDFGEQEDAVTLEGIEGFEGLVGKHQAIIAFSSYWGEGRFPAEAVRIVTSHESIPLIYWSPWDRPYSEEHIIANGPDRFRLENILEGRCDEYIDAWADAAKAVGRPFFVSFCNEMNGSWFPWSGWYYGSERPIAGTVPEKYTGPEYFKRAYRYVVDRVRARGAANILWVFQVNNFGDPYSEGNAVRQYYPGKNYVDWLGMSVYGQLFPDRDARWEDFDDIIDKPYAELAAVDLTKPIMLAEWGVGEFPTYGDKAAWIKDAFERMEQHFPRLHAAVYWHERWQNDKNQLYSNLRVNSSPQALAIYREGVASSFWLDHPIYR